MQGGTVISNAILNTYKAKQSGNYTVEIINTVELFSTSEIKTITVLSTPTAPLFQ